jgi:hypothetical protein
MSRPAAEQAADREDLRSYRAICALHDRHAHQIKGQDLNWLLGVAAKVKAGEPLSPREYARVSRIRAEIARSRHYGGER